MNTDQIPFLTVEQMIEVDRLMIDVYGIQLIQMMENAGRHLADLARERFFGGDPAGKKVMILAGSGGNGGGALVCARNLNNWGADIQIILSKDEKELSGVIKSQAKILKNLGIRHQLIGEYKSSHKFELIVDGIIGYNLFGKPQGNPAQMITWANRQNTPILALDIPSGINATTGEVYQPAIQASATMTLALPKIGLKNAPPDSIGELYLADIGVPPELYSRPSLNLRVGNIFKERSIIPLD